MMKLPRFVQMDSVPVQSHQEELNQTLQAQRAFVAPKYFYNELGSKLFEAITCVPEYYPTRTEASILHARRAELRTLLPHEATLIDLGAGNCKKAVALFDVIRPEHYVAIDISAEFLRQALEAIQREYPHMDLTGLGTDFSNHLELPDSLGIDPKSPKLFFYPGSSISNFTPEEALGFLTRIRTLCEHTPGSGLLIGVDLVKDKKVLEAAYDDALGVTAAFNRNALLNINSNNQTNFALEQWAHLALFNTEQSRIEMHLQAKCDLELRWNQGQRLFTKGDTIHTENSYKWLESEFESVLKKAGFTRTRAFMDDQNWFSVIWATCE
ncbi:MAG: L-histidine N(alpha)-methyltransferase [Limnobacter sp.]|nr:L-histidine N(alpha)-methyltransferase [Limnobacter sp.]